MTEIYIKEVRCLVNFDTWHPFNNLLVCLHGNSMNADIFLPILAAAKNKIQTIAVDIPGCGKSLRLPQYSMEIVGEKIKEAIDTFKDANLYFFGHSFGGHLIPFIKVNTRGFAVSGTPPLSSSADFPLAFKPSPEALELMPLLSKRESFTLEEASKFIRHQGINKGELFENMVQNATQVDGCFREGCLRTLTDIDQVEWMKQFRNTVVFHAVYDGVISLNYLYSLDKQYLFEGRIHLLLCRHLSPVFFPEEIIDTLMRAFF